MNLRRDLPVVAILATAVAAPALGQTAAPATGVALNAASIPDFSGAWAHPGVGFGPPLSGPGPVVNKSRLPSGQSNSDQLVGDYSNPILKPAAAEVVKRNGEIALSGKAIPDPDSQCLQNPVPYIFWNFYLRILQQPNKITLVYQHDDDFRQVPLNRPHPAKIVPSVHGESVGHYEGDTLVIDTVGVKVGPFPTPDLYAMVDLFGTPHTPALHVVERYRLLDHEAAKAIEEQNEEDNAAVALVDNGIARDPDYKGKGLQLELSVEDEGVFTMPWSASMVYWPPLVPFGQWPEITCAENANGYDGRNLTKKAPMPIADKPDF